MPPQGYPYSPHPSPLDPQSQTNLKAILSMVFGLIGIVVFPIIGSIVAVILGHMARKEIQADPRQQGDGLAIAGLVMGWIMIGLVGLIIGFVILALIVALIVFVVLSIVFMATGEEDEERPGWPWPSVQDVRPTPHP